MGRRTRLHVPGGIHHVVSRTQGHGALLEASRDSILAILKSGIVSAGARLLAYAIMPNHLHLLVVQGQARLGWVMQGPMRRVALLIQQTHHIQGHVFERRFRSKLCLTEQHVHNSVLYIHRNPVKAALCAHADDYRWSSHAVFCGFGSDDYLAVEEGLRWACRSSSSNIAELRRAYIHAFREYCAGPDDDSFAWAEAERAPRSPILHIADMSNTRPARADLRDVSLRLLEIIDRTCDVDLVRSNVRIPQVRQTRSQLIAALLQRGYRGCDIASFLRISDSTVSRVNSQMRFEHLV